MLLSDISLLNWIIAELSEIVPSYRNNLIADILPLFFKKFGGKALAGFIIHHCIKTEFQEYAFNIIEAEFSHFILDPDKYNYSWLRSYEYYFNERYIIERVEVTL
jgi:hypothetical protein